ncbi:MAG: bacillithiol biosynthesis deacetylase BshB1 [Nitrospinota bacterium]|nr:bacillithiol biosynthesis deacetylase BshB1 [Nitrospinota bacterium]MDH5677925.1 bacillithiol biosynthesis deacetylase BshB1 [Nitrospinota bacterium]MDH5755754.1 bacillithiol biosynthesis deacetylase BshB1 [Nitrospinota bacterium]
MVDVLVVGAHPDDIEMGFGASVAMLTQKGHEVAFLDLTNGEPTPFGDPETRKSEATKATEILGACQRITLDLPNRELMDTVEARHKVAQVYRMLKPKLLFIQKGADAHPDHMAGSQVATKARFDAKLTRTNMHGEPFYPSRVFGYLSSHLKIHVKPAFILDVSETFPKKLEAVLTYKSQFAAANREEIILKHLEEVGAYYGRLIGADYGEPVFCDEEIGLSDIRDLRF